MKVLYIKLFTTAQANRVTMQSIMCINYKNARELFNKWFLPQVLKVTEQIYWKIMGGKWIEKGKQIENVSSLHQKAMVTRMEDPHSLLHQGWFYCPAVQSGTWNLSEKPLPCLSQASACIRNTEELRMKISSWRNCRMLKKKIFWMLKRGSAPRVCEKINLQSEC